MPDLYLYRKICDNWGTLSHVIRTRDFNGFFKKVPPRGAFLTVVNNVTHTSLATDTEILMRTYRHQALPSPLSPLPLSSVFPTPL